MTDEEEAKYKRLLESAQELLQERDTLRATLAQREAQLARIMAALKQLELADP